jgi:hypothetical protein
MSARLRINVFRLRQLSMTNLPSTVRERPRFAALAIWRRSSTIVKWRNRYIFHLLRPAGYRVTFMGVFNLPSRLLQRLSGHEFNLHEDQVLITAIDDVVLDSGGPEVCYASGKLGG